MPKLKNLINIIKIIWNLKLKENSDNRGLGIKNYLQQNNIREYIILDDDIFPDYDEELQKHLVKTNFYQDGLNEELSQIAIKKLQKKENKL